jgi:methyl-accepting chemotaxis protein
MNQTICGTHNDIADIVKRIAVKVSRIISLMGKIEGDASDTASEASAIADDIDSECSTVQDLIKEALSSGQSMEDRLREYRDTIESLGFKRIK